MISMMASAHIININGAPGIGKSTLAIQVGYKVMIENGTSVRYINMNEKLSLFKTMIKPKKRVDHMLVHHQYSEQIRSREMRSVIEVSMQIILNYESVSNDETHYNGFIEELQIWSDSIHCPTILILDNCDDILASSSRDNLVSLIYSLINRSHFNLHVIIVSTEKLLLLKSFNRWTVPGLSQSASELLLGHFVAPISSTALIVTELLEGNPLALKIFGKLLCFHEHFIHQIKSLLINKHSLLERINTVFDVAFGRLGELKCGYILSLFPGSFDMDAGTAMTSTECFKLYEQYFLLDWHHLILYFRRYQMHNLIKEYVKEKLNDTTKIKFNTMFKNYYLIILLKYARRNDLDTFDRYSISLEHHNFNHLKGLLLQSKQQSAEQLAVLAFLAVTSECDLQLEELNEYFSLYMEKIGDVCQLLSPTICGQFYLHVVKYSYQNCKCETSSEYVLNIFHPSCMDIFKCIVVNQIINLCEHTTLCTQLSFQENLFIQRLVNESACISVFDSRSYGLILTMVIIIIFSGTLCSFIHIMVYNESDHQGLSPCLFIHTLLLVLLLTDNVFALVIQFTESYASIDNNMEEYSLTSPLVLQILTRKCCIIVSTLLILCTSFLLACTLNSYIKTFKDISNKIIIMINFMLMVTFYYLFGYAKINILMCGFLPVCH